MACEAGEEWRDVLFRLLAACEDPDPRVRFVAQSNEAEGPLRRLARVLAGGNERSTER